MLKEIPDKPTKEQLELVKEKLDLTDNELQLAILFDGFNFLLHLAENDSDGGECKNG